MNKWQSALSLAVVVLATTVVGWAWWNGAGPFRSRDQTPPREYVNQMEGIEYVNVSVSFGEFLDATSPTRWTQDQNKYLAWEGEKIQSYPPFVRLPVQRARVPLTPQQQKEMREAHDMSRDFTRSLTEVASGEGYRTLPYWTNDRTSVNQVSVAEMHATVKTSRQKNLVIFQSELSLSRSIPTERVVFQYESATSTKIRSQYKKNILERARLSRITSPVYVVDNKDALKGIRSVLQRQAKNMFEDNRRSYVTQVDAQYQLSMGVSNEQ